MHLSRAIFSFWAAGLIAHMLLLIVLLARHHAKTFPLFTTLIAANVLNSIALYQIALHGSKHTYFVAYFAFAILDLVLQLSVTYDARHVFCPTGTLGPRHSQGLSHPCACLARHCIGLACLPPLQKTVLGMLLDRGNLFSSALQCELLVGMIAFSIDRKSPMEYSCCPDRPRPGFLLPGRPANRGRAQRSDPKYDGL